MTRNTSKTKTITITKAKTIETETTKTKCLDDYVSTMFLIQYFLCVSNEKKLPVLLK